MRHFIHWRSSQGSRKRIYYFPATCQNKSLLILSLKKMKIHILKNIIILVLSLLLNNFDLMLTIYLKIYNYIISLYYFVYYFRNEINKVQ